MASRKSMGTKLAMLAKACGKSQTEIAAQLKMPVSQLNRFLRGHSDLTATNFSAVLCELGIDLDELVARRIQRSADLEDGLIETPSDVVAYLFRSLDDLGQQTYLNNLAWAAKVSRKGKLPAKVEEILKRELTLI